MQPSTAYLAPSLDLGKVPEAKFPELDAARLVSVWAPYFSVLKKTENLSHLQLETIHEDVFADMGQDEVIFSPVTPKKRPFVPRDDLDWDAETVEFRVDSIDRIESSDHNGIGTVVDGWNNLVQKVEKGEATTEELVRQVDKKVTKLYGQIGNAPDTVGLLPCPQLWGCVSEMPRYVAQVEKLDTENQVIKKRMMAFEVHRGVVKGLSNDLRVVQTTQDQSKN